MPKLLTSEAARLIEGAVEALRLAMTGIGAARTPGCLEERYCFAPETGLIGAAADLALKSCMCQVVGRKSLLKADGAYKTASETLADYRRLLRSGANRLSNLTQGVAEPDEHLRQLLEATQGFRLLFTVRATALHMAEGVSKPVVVTAVNDVRHFIEVLGASARFTPYTRGLPAAIETTKERFAIAQELAAAVEQARGARDAGALLVQMHLVLPDIPDDEPDWLAALDRVAVTPRRRDLSCLITSLRRAYPTQLFRVGRTGEGMPAVVAPEDPNALPIAPQYLRWSLTQSRDQWHSDVGLANGRLAEGMLHLPPLEFVYQLFVAGLQITGLTPEALEEGLTAHQAWPFVAASLNVPSRGTTGPLWFLIDALRPREHGQLLAQLRTAANVGGTMLARGLQEMEQAMECRRDARPLQATDPWTERMEPELDRISRLTPVLEETLEDALENAATPEAFIAARVQEDNSVGGALLAIADDAVPGLSPTARRRWARVLCEVADAQDDGRGVYAVLANNELAGAHTAARKAMRLIDFLEYGPSLPPQAS